MQNKEIHEEALDRILPRIMGVLMEEKVKELPVLMSIMMSITCTAIASATPNKNLLIAEAVCDNFKFGILDALKKQEGWI